MRNAKRLSFCLTTTLRVHAKSTKTVITWNLGKISRVSTPRPALLTAENMVTFHHSTTAASKIFSLCFNILKNDDNTNAIFIQLPMKAYKRARNLNDLLVHSSLPPDQPRQHLSLRALFPADETSVVPVLSSILTPGRVIGATGHFTCTSENLIYCI